MIDWDLEIACVYILLQVGWLAHERFQHSLIHLEKRMQMVSIQLTPYGYKHSIETRNCRIQNRWNFSIIISSLFFSFFFFPGEISLHEKAHTLKGWNILSILGADFCGWTEGAKSQECLCSYGYDGKAPCARISQPVSTNQCGLSRSILWTAINKRTLCLISLMDITFCLQLYLAKACRWLWTLSQWLGLDGSLLACSPVL